MPEPYLLSYATRVEPCPLTAGAKSATLRVMVTNPNPSAPVTLRMLGITVPTGTASEALLLPGDDTSTPIPPADMKLNQTQAANTGTSARRYLFTAVEENKGVQLG